MSQQQCEMTSSSSSSGLSDFDDVSFVDEVESVYEDDVKALYDAMKGWGTDEDALIDITVNRSFRQRQEIAELFKQTYGKSLHDELAGETSGSFKRLLLSMYSCPEEIEAENLHKAMKGLGTDEKVLYDVLTGKNQQEIASIKKCYEEVHGRPLMEDIWSELSGDLRCFLSAILNGSRNESKQTDFETASREAGQLFEAGEMRIGTDEDVFIRILAQRSDAQLRKTFKFYRKISGKSILESISDEFSGHLKRSLMAFCSQILEGQATFHAKRLYEAMDGIGTDDSEVIRIISSRSEKDLWRIQRIYRRVTGSQKTLYEHLESETSGDYKKLLLKILKKFAVC